MVTKQVTWCLIQFGMAALQFILIYRKEIFWVNGTFMTGHLSSLSPLSLCRVMQHCTSSTQSDCRVNIPTSLQSCSSPPLCGCLSGSLSSWSLGRRRHSLLACGSSCPPSCWLSLCPSYLTPCTLWLQSGEWASPVHTCCHGECGLPWQAWVTMVSMGCHGEHGLPWQAWVVIEKSCS